MAKHSVRSKGKRSATSQTPVTKLSLAFPKGAKPGLAGNSTLQIDPTCEPEIYAAVLDAIGQAHLASGEYGKAHEILDFSLSFHLKLYGTAHASLIDSRLHLASVLRRLGKLAEARELIVTALHRAREGYAAGASSIQLGLALNELAALEFQSSNWEKAENLAEESQQLLRDAKDPHVTLPMDTLARLHSMRGAHAAAEIVYQQMVAIDKDTVLGVEHPRYAAHLHNLATVLYLQGKLPAAARHFDKVQALLLKAHGPFNPDLADVYANLGRLEQDRGNCAKASEYFNLALSVNRKIRGPQHAFVGYDLANLGRLALEQGQAKAAVRHLSNAVDIFQAFYRQQPHLYTANALMFLGIALLEAQDPCEARIKLKESIGMWRLLAGNCKSNRGIAGQCDEKFASLALSCAEAACAESKQFTAVNIPSQDAETLARGLQKRDLRMRLLRGWTKCGRVRREKEAVKNTATLAADEPAPAASQV
jgi:eukaryotic-like serine/threonine-protein kinase